MEIAIEEQDRLVSIPEAAQLAGVDVKTVRRWILKGAIDVVKLPSGHHRVRLETLGRDVKVMPPKPKAGVYFAHAVALQLVKIGASANPRSRLSQLRCSMPFKITTLGILHRVDAFDYEGRLHEQFRSFHVKGEWFSAEQALLDAVGQLLSPSNSGQTN